MQASLEDFFKALRGSDLHVSLSAQLDAARAVALVGWSDPVLLKSALGATLAKTIHEHALLDDVFDRFFRAESAFKDWAPAGSRVKEGSAYESDPRVVQRDDAPPLVALLLSGDTAALVRHLQRAAREVGLSDIWFFSQKGRYIRDIQQAMGMSALESELEAALSVPALRDGAQQLEAARQRLFEEVRRYVEHRLALFGSAGTREMRDEALVEAKLANIGPMDHARVRRIVEKIAKRLAERNVRRNKRSRHGHLDFSRTLRRNAAYGGLLVEPVWRHEVVERPRIVAICDVSGSVRQYSRFLLLFLHSMGEQVSGLRSFAFTNHLVEVSDIFASFDVDVAIDRVMQAMAGSGTDYGQVMLDLNETLLDDIDRRTTVLILGDARNNRARAQADVLQRVYQRARRVLWLNPEPASQWGVGDSEMKRYAPYCHLVRECNSVRQLEQVLDALLRSHASSA
jgi:uncharacterized protein with von Willebrand factor type A (vWA) domain